MILREECARLYCVTNYILKPLVIGGPCQAVDQIMVDDINQKHLSTTLQVYRIILKNIKLRND